MADQKPTCFVVMGFGRKTDLETGRTLDLDKSYKNMIKPAVEAAGLRCVRADEIVHSGLIDVPMYDQILNADVVVADLSTSNNNAFYELGVRHALRPHATIVIAEDGIKTVPFDVNRVFIRRYQHLGKDIGFDEVMRFRAELTEAIREILARDPRDTDSPVYRFIPGLLPPGLPGTTRTTGEPEQPIGSSEPEVVNEAVMIGAPEAAEEKPHSELMSQVDEAEAQGDFIMARAILQHIHALMKAQPQGTSESAYIVQRLARVTYKSMLPNQEQALRDARDLLRLLNPERSNDTETLGLWAAVHKRLWALTDDLLDLDQAIRAMERSFDLRRNHFVIPQRSFDKDNDYYDGINLSFLLQLRATRQEDPAEAIADAVRARHVRREVLRICEDWLGKYPAPAPRTTSPKELERYHEMRYWVLAARAEAAIGLEDPRGEQLLQEALATTSHDWMTYSTQKQVDKLRALIADSPLKHVSAAAPAPAAAAG